MKKFLSVLLMICMLFSLTLTGCAEETSVTSEPLANDSTTIILKIGSPTMVVNGTEKAIDEQGTAPVIISDRTLLPVRAVVEEMGGTVGWNEENQEVTLKYGSDTIRLTIDSNEAYLNDETKTLDVAPAIINDRTMLPIRFVAESFNFNVEWNESSQEVTIKKSAVTETPQQPTENNTSAKKSIVVYFSATGNTKALAEKIAAESNSDIFEIVPQEPYTSADLNYNTDCRANKEQNDASARPRISSKLDNIADYDNIFIGYPIWWGTMPKIINTFLESYDLSNKTIMPFCTSGGSGISSSVSAIKSICTNSTVKDGFRGSSSTESDRIQDWFKTIGFESAD